MWFVLALLSCLSVFAASPAALLDPLPVRFEPNPGLQKGPRKDVRWSARGLGYAFLFTDEATLLHVGDRSVKLTFPGSSSAASFGGADRMAVSTNYFSGKQYASVPAFRKLRRTGVYPGIDVVYYGNGREIEYDFEIAPGADPSVIRMRFEGADAVRLNDGGEIVLTLGGGEIAQRPPVVYQRRASGEVIAIEGRYELENGVARLALGAYDRAQPLIVDPTVVYQAFLAGTSTDSVSAIAHDAQGLIYLAGSTVSVDFPATTDGYQTTNPGESDAWVMQLDPTAGANAILYCSYLGGVSNEFVKAMTIDQNNLIYITGSTDGTDFPVTASALQSTIAANTHAFVAVFDPSQQGSPSLLYSTYLGGSNNDEGDGIAVANGKVYVTGWTTSSDFPVAAGYQSTLAGSYDAFVVEIDPTQSGTASEIAGTYLGGTGQDIGRSIAVDAAGRVYITGVTFSFDFPTTANAYQSIYIGGGDIFIAELDLGAVTLNYSTYFGGTSADEAKKILLTPLGNVALAGYTLSPDFPVTQNGYQTKFGGNQNAFLSVLNVATGSSGLLYSTYYGGTGGEVAYDLRLDSYGRYYLGGYTLSTDLPVTPASAYSSSSAGDGVDGFVSVIDPTASFKGLVYGTYITGAGLQTVYGVDVVDPPAGSRGSPTNPTVEIVIAGNATSNIFSGNVPPNPDPGKSSVFLLLMQVTAPAPASTSLAVEPAPLRVDRLR